jgi:hypothetical protein
VRVFTSEVTRTEKIEHWWSSLGTGMTSQLRALCSKKAWSCGENRTTNRLSLVLSATWPMSSNCKVSIPARAPYTRSVSQFSKIWEIGQACSAAKVQLETGRSLRLTGAAAALRQNIGARSRPRSKPNLESGLHPARQALTNAASEAAWSEGWALPVEKGY